MRRRKFNKRRGSNYARKASKRRRATRIKRYGSSRGGIRL